MRRLLALVAVCIALTGCMTNRKMTNVPVSLRETQWRDVESILVDGEFLRALQYIEHLSSSTGGNIPPDQLMEFRKQALVGLVTSAEEARDDRVHRSAIMPGERHPQGDQADHSDGGRVGPTPITSL